MNTNTTSSPKTNSFRAIVIGGTGATGRCLINQLLNNDNCRKVTSIGRRSIINDENHDKLIDIIVDSYTTFHQQKIIGLTMMFFLIALAQRVNVLEVQKNLWILNSAYQMRPLRWHIKRKYPMLH